MAPSRTTFFLLFLALCIGIGSFFGVNFYLQHQKKQEESRLAQLEQEKNEQQRKKRHEQLEKLFQTYLNDFKDDLRTKAGIYKEQRKILKEISSPYNYETTGYAKENYELFKASLAPKLRAQASAIIDTFESYREKLRAEVENTDSETAQTFLSKWEEMSQEQLEHYVDFFAHEEERLQAYEELIKFYYVYSKRFSVDMEHNILIFDNDEDAKKERELLAVISKIESDYKKRKR